MTRPAPSAYVFDAYGTLFDVHSAAARLSADIGPKWERLSELWRTKQLEYTWVLAAAGRHDTFRAVTERALDYAIEAVGGLPDPRLRAALIDAYRTLDAYPEVASVLSELKARGAKTAILSNGDPDMLAEAVSAAGLSGAFDDVISVERAGIFKPAMRVYRLAVDALGVPPDGISFQSSNRWDIAGAHLFGMRTVWVNRGGKPDEYPDQPPDRIASDLGALVAA